MSRVDDLIDLIRAANDTYLMNPSRNVRMAYILVDNLCELAIKSYLQAKTRQRQEACLADLERLSIVTSQRRREKLAEYFAGRCDLDDLARALRATEASRAADLQRTLQSHGAVGDWSPNHPHGGYKTFVAIVAEVKQLNPVQSTPALHLLLDAFVERREKRNQFFHDPQLAGLTVSEEECLKAFCDLYNLMRELFGQQYRDCLVVNAIPRAQCAVMRLKLKGFGAQAAYAAYETMLRAIGPIQLHPGALGHHYCVIYEDADRFHERLVAHYEAMVADRRAEIGRIDGLRRPNRTHRQNRLNLEGEMRMLQHVLSDCIR